MKTIILIAGMHRSGTSALARVVNLLGVTISNELLMPSKDNRFGYWESTDVYRFHEGYFDKFGLSWSSILPFSDKMNNNAHYLDALYWIEKYMNTEFGQVERIVIKDPRLARFLPIWKVALQSMNFDIKVIIPYRIPSEVAASLNKREIDNPLHTGIAFSNQYLALLWLRYVLEAEKSSRKLKRSFLTYHSLLRNWRQASMKMERDLDFFWNPKDDDYQNKIDTFVMSDLHRSKDILIDEIEQLPWIHGTFKALKLLELDPYDPTAMQTLDSINEELARADGIFTEIIKESEAKAKELKSKQEKNQQQIANLQSKLAHIEHERNMAMQDSFQELRLERDKLLAQVQDLSAKVTSLTQENENAKVSDNLIKDKSQIKHE